MKQKIYFLLIVLTLTSLAIRLTGAYAKFSEPPVLAPEISDTPEHVTQTGKASWYSEHSPGIRLRTANNEIFNDSDLTCAMWDVPFNQKIKVTNKANGRSVVVRVNDRGPHRRFVRKGRIIDLSKEAFRKISPLKNGLIDIELEIL